MSIEIIDLESFELDPLGRVIVSDDLLERIQQFPSIASAGANPVNCTGTSNGDCTNGTYCGGSTNTDCSNPNSCGNSSNQVCR